MSKPISKKMSIQEVVFKWPETMETFLEYGLHCVGCMAAQFENIEQGALAHGIDVDRLIEALNKVVADIKNNSDSNEVVTEEEV